MDSRFHVPAENGGNKMMKDRNEAAHWAATTTEPMKCQSSIISLSKDTDSQGILQICAQKTEGTSPVSAKGNPALNELVRDIEEEISSTRRAPHRIGVLSIKTANEWIEDASRRPDPILFFHGLIVQNENTVLFASSNVGKSTIAVQLAEDIAQTHKVYYLDLELTDKQFQMRYTDPYSGRAHIFPSNFMRAEVDPELIGGADLEQDILDSIEEAAKEDVKFIIVDNLTFICHDAEKSSQASEFMMKLIRLKKKYGLTTIVIAHTPKRYGYEPITQNDLAGSSKLISFFDAGIALARSARDNDLRYLKQVKVRTGEYKYDADNVMVLDLVHENGFLHFEINGYAKEEEHLLSRNQVEDEGELLEILRLRRDGKSLREIGKTLGMTRSKVQRRLKKAQIMDISLSDDDESGVSGVSPVSVPIQPIHPDTPPFQLALPLTTDSHE